MKPSTAQWIEVAENDFQSVEILNESRQRGQLSNICYLSHQSAEKYMKGMLTELEVAFPRTHDLERLLDLLEPHFPIWESLRPATAHLTGIASNIRYPGIIPKPELGKQCIAECMLIRRTVRAELGLETK